MYKNKPISMIYARSLDGAIGVNGKLPWRSKKDLQIFKSMTLGCCVIMGRKTWESLPVKPLPDRECIVITKQKDYQATGAIVVSSLEEALDRANVPIVVIGGESIYNEAMQYTDTIHVSVMQTIIPRIEGYEYAVAPKIPSDFGQDTQTHHSGENSQPAFMFMTYSRREPECTRTQILPKVAKMDNHSLG